jgi:Protein kinase domain
MGAGEERRLRSAGNGGQMSVEPSEAMQETWTRLQGQVVNGAFPLGRYLGGSEHSGVFLTKSEARGPADLAIKIVSTSRALAELQLPRWKRAGSLDHAHLLRLLEWGGCQLEGLPYLYCVMEYADQTLAQLLAHRALTDDETREMLTPVLDALVFLHGRNLVQGQLKPANILVVGDRLKLASDTIRRLGEAPASGDASGLYDPAEASHGNAGSAADIWALGVSLCQALTRRVPSGLREPRDAVVLPEDFTPAFRAVVARCLSLRPQDRPSALELAEWTRGGPLAPVPTGSRDSGDAAVVVTGGKLQQATPAGTAAAQLASAMTRAAAAPQSRTARAWLGALVAVVILALAWSAVRLSRTAPAAPPAPIQLPAATPAPSASATSPAAQESQVPAPALAGTKSAHVHPGTASAANHQVLPEVAQSARRSIRGHIKVWVRASVDPDGSVSAAVADRTGPSSYFERLAVAAAKQWTFPAADTPGRRLMQIRFDFARDGTTASAVALH